MEGNSGSPGLFCQGTSGTGKTLSTKYLKDLLEKEKVENNYKVLYINCTDNSTLTSISKTLYQEVSGKTDVKGLAYGDYLKLFLKECEQKYKFFVLILDEVDHILPKDPHDDNFFYILIRARELGYLKKCYQSIICIANSIDCREKLSEGTRSSFGLNWVHFPRYKVSEIQDILQQRAEKAFQPNSISPELLQDIAKYFADRGGDVREAISILRMSSEEAERNKREQITMDDFNKARRSYEQKMLNKELDDFGLSEKLTFLVLAAYYQKNNKAVPFSHLYVMYRQMCEKLKREPTDERQVRNHLKKLMKANIIDEFSEGRKNYYKPMLSSTTIQDILVELYDKYQTSADDFLREMEDNGNGNKTEESCD